MSDDLFVRVLAPSQSNCRVNLSTISRALNDELFYFLDRDKHLKSKKLKHSTSLAW